jgi:trk system potassium uptake protein TrkH
LLYLLGWTAMAAGAALCLPVPFSFVDGDGLCWAFALSAAVLFILGACAVRAGRGPPERVLVREGACFLVGTWILLTVTAALPYFLAGALSPADAWAEGVSGVTTTGLTLLPSNAPRSLIFWRSLTQWLGGACIILLLLTVVPQVSEWFGMSLVMPRGQRASQLLSSMRRTSRRVMGVYAGATAVATTTFALLGLSGFDALNLSMVTLATGGCFVPETGTGSPMLYIAMMAVMLFSAGNFFFYSEITRRGLDADNPGAGEMRAMLRLVAGAGLLISLHLWLSGVYGVSESLQKGFFAAAAFLSTTGMNPSLLAGWPDFDRFVLILLIFIGGCIASSAGGLKILRLSVLANASIEELRRTLHSRMVLRVSALGRMVPLSMVGQLLSFFALYTAVFFGAAMALSLAGIAPLSAMGLSAACLTSAGPAALLAGDVGAYASMGEGWRLFCCLLMLLGRLEVFSFLFVIQTVVSRWEGRW